jgi:hypothetical protein
VTCSTPAIIHRPELRVIMSVKLDRLAVGSILKQSKVFLSQCLTGANANSHAVYIGRYISCCWNSPRIAAANGRWMGIDNESNQVE